MKNDTLTCEQCHKSCKERCTDSGPRGNMYFIVLPLWKIITIS